ncbi:MAG: N-acetylmuramoyl-L-alanine amidase [Synergistaceae bacterium]|jgi:N-acetylmuramoyl-L-alanine amidase|nr:N-acetylmuramoyl-L-alanine amidase [Synergistaceae bacterium]
MELAQGDIRKGRVSMLERDGVRYAALDEVMTRLAFAPSSVTGGFVVTFSGRKMEFWSGSNVARVNGTVFTLPTNVFFEDGHWWGEANVSLQVVSNFLSSVSRPYDIKWIPSASQPASRPSAGVPAAPAAKAPPVKPPVRPSDDWGVISGVRWGEQLDAYRAVIDISRQVETVLREHPDRVEVVFSNSSVEPFSSRSPWAPLAAASMQSEQNAVLTFIRPPGAVKSFWLSDPPRYVVDFYFGGPAAPPEPQPSAPPARIETNPKRSRSGKFLVVIDAGHGGHDPGAAGNKLREKDINLRAAIELAESAKALGLDVKLTRADDRYLKLAERTAFANNNNADIFISLHCNALPKGQHASGTELYLMAQHTDRDALNLAIIENREILGEAQSSADINAAADKRTQLLLKILGDMQQSDKINESTTLAEHLYDKMRTAQFPIRKVRQAPFFVLRGAGMPAVLVEMGYITEASDAKQLNSAQYRKKMMDSLAAGILNYLNKRPGEGGR